MTSRDLITKKKKNNCRNKSHRETRYIKSIKEKKRSHKENPILRKLKEKAHKKNL